MATTRSGSSSTLAPAPSGSGCSDSGWPTPPIPSCCSSPRPTPNRCSSSTWPPGASGSSVGWSWSVSMPTREPSPAPSATATAEPSRCTADIWSAATAPTAPFAARRDPVQRRCLPADLRAGRPGGRRRPGRRHRLRLAWPGGDPVLVPAWPARQLAAAGHATPPLHGGGRHRHGLPWRSCRHWRTTSRGGRCGSAIPLWLTYFRLGAPPRQPLPGRTACSWPATPPTSTARPAPRA